MSAIKTFLRVPLRGKWYSAQIFVLSAKYRRRILKKPFAQWCNSIGTLGQETQLKPISGELPAQLWYLVPRVCKHTPWESKCLVQALTAKELLNRHGYPCTLYMGVARDDSGKMIAHAWLRCGDAYITGGNGTGYAVTTKFADKE